MLTILKAIIEQSNFLQERKEKKLKKYFDLRLGGIPR